MTSKILRCPDEKSLYPRGFIILPILPVEIITGNFSVQIQHGKYP
jgi:hypothetical protein